MIAGDGSVAGSNVAETEGGRLAEGGRRLVEDADRIRAGHGLGAVAQLEAATTAGSVFVVREGDRLIVATTTPEPTVGLVFYDLKTCLRSVDGEQPKPKRRTTRKKAEDAPA